MAVIINDFEVVPERTEEPTAAPAAGRQSSPQPPLTMVELERMLRNLQERLDRVRAS